MINLGDFRHQLVALYRKSMRFDISPINFEDGGVLQALSFLVAAKGGNVFVDAGAGVGFSTLWIIKGIYDRCGSKCRLIAVELNGERFKELERNLRGITGENLKIEFIKDDAVEFFKSIQNNSVDLVHIDIDKSRYVQALKVLEPKVRHGGVVVFHNAITPPAPEELFKLASSELWSRTLIPTECGLLVLCKSTFVENNTVYM